MNGSPGRNGVDQGSLTFEITQAEGEKQEWFRELRSQVQAWIGGCTEETAQEAAVAPTKALADLLIAFGLASVRETEVSRTLLEQAGCVLGGGNEVHQFLFQAFHYRVQQCLNSGIHSGSLSPELLTKLSGMDKITRYRVDRLRKHSRILEPEDRVELYWAWYQNYAAKLSKELRELDAVWDRSTLQQKLEILSERYAQNGPDAPQKRARILQAALEMAPRIDKSFAKPFLDEVQPALQPLSNWRQKVELLQAALLAAAHFDEVAYVDEFVACLQRLLGQHWQTRDLPILAFLASQCSGGLRKKALRATMHQFIARLSDALLNGKTVADVPSRENWPTVVYALLHFTAAWSYFGIDSLGQPILEEAHRLLFHEEHLWERGGGGNWYEKCKLAMAYIVAIGQVPEQIARVRINELFTQLRGITSNWTTNAYFNLSQLQIIEAAVWMILGGQPAFGGRQR
jgi:hypothetical protein